MAAPILLVEDDLLVRMGIALTLEAQGFEVLACATGEAALELAAANSLSLVLMDVKLAGAMDGIEAAERISSRHGVPIIFVTAQSNASTRREMLATRPRGFLPKPFTPRQLTDTVAGVLSSTGPAEDGSNRHQGNNALNSIK